MKIVVDLDGPVYEFARTVRYMLNAYRGKNLPPVSEFWTTWWPEAISEDDWKWVFSDAISLGLFRYGHVTRGAILGLRKLYEQGHSLVVGTHRPSAAVPDTLAWLSYLNLPWSDVHILSNEEPKTQIDGDILIDDKPENVSEWHTQGRMGILFKRPWNLNTYAEIGIWYAPDWEGIVRCVDTMVDEFNNGSSDNSTEAAIRSTFR